MNAQLTEGDSATVDQFDCVVVGAGVAGCTTAALVAEAGYSTLLVERDRVPRFHVGESLMPETYWTFQRLGVLPKLHELGFVRKVGVQFVSSNGKESQPFFFRDHDPRESSTTWHVERADFDKMLYETAIEKGAIAVDNTRVTDLNLEGEWKTVTLQDSNGGRTVKTKVLVDATGQSALIANRLGLREDNQQLRKASIWTYYRGAQRNPDGLQTTTILHTCDKQSWFWYIPLRNDIVSVGVVGDNDFLLKNRGTPEHVFAEELEKCPAVQQRIGQGQRCDKFHVAKEFSYTTRQHAGDGWVLVGDAFGFIDPVYSSGVFLALKSGEMAADAIIEGLQNGNLTAEQLGKWTTEFKQGIIWIRKLVHAFYTDEFSFGMFLKKHPEHAGCLTDLLIGRVFHDAAGRIFDDMDPAIQQAISTAEASS